MAEVVQDLSKQVNSIRFDGLLILTVLKADKILTIDNMEL